MPAGGPVCNRMTECSPEIVAQAERIIGYRFTDAKLLGEALTHASVAEDHLASNERLEFLGDAILGFVVCEYLFQHYPKHREGELTKIKSTVVSRRTCAIVSEAIGLADLLSLGKGMSSRADLPSSVAAAVYESIVGAIYLDGGMGPTRTFILRDMTDRIITAEESQHHHNYKSVLQQHTQQKGIDLPTYRVIDEKGPDHSKCFEVCVMMHGRQFASAWGPNKKDAEQHAARNALETLGLLDE